MQQPSLRLWNQASAIAPGRLEAIAIPDGELLWAEQFWQDIAENESADEVFRRLHDQVAWRQDYITIFGKRQPQPRLTAWYGDPGTTYCYSGLLLKPRPWLPILQHLKALVESAAQARFNSVLLNLYRTGQDGMGWHSDNEAELGREPTIASLSFGATRRFVMGHVQNRQETKIELPLSHGSLLVMKGKTQHHWQHQVPKTVKPVGPRINLTFRLIR